MLVTKPPSTVLLTEPPRAMGLSETPSFVNVTLSLDPGVPAGDQFAPVDQSVSPTPPLHNIAAASMEVAVVSRQAKIAMLMTQRNFFIKRDLANEFTWKL